MRRRPSRRFLWLAVLGIVIAAVFVGAADMGEAGRVVGGLIAIRSARDWSGYWAARDRFEAWRKRLKR